MSFAVKVYENQRGKGDVNDRENVSSTKPGKVIDFIYVAFL